MCCGDNKLPSGKDAEGPVCSDAGCVEPEIHMHVDADRDGKADDDRTGIDNWEWGAGKKGAIIFCNNDDDDGASRSDNEDNKINGGNDKDEIGPLVFRRKGPSPPGDWEGFLEVSTADAKRIRMFESRSTGASEILGPAKGNSFKFPDLSFTEKEMGMEATQYADKTWNGEIMLTFKIMKAGTVKSLEQAKVRVAPWIMPNHLDPGEKVFVVQCGAIIDTPAGTIDNSHFRGDLGTAVSAAGCTVQTHSTNDIWMQDCMEFGFSNLPTTGFRSVMRADRNRPLQNFPKTLRKADFGYHEQGSLTPSPTFNSTGNLECTPPVTSKAGKKYPWGRIYFGPGRPAEEMNADVRAFLDKQVVQEPIRVNTNWLAVGHVDEIISFVPAPGPKGFKLLLASPGRAYEILKNNKKKHGAEKMLVGRKFRKDIVDPITHHVTGFTWQDAEVSIKTFLDTGIPSLSLAAVALKTFNDAKQAELDVTRGQLKTELGLEDSDIIHVPILFMPNQDFPAFADALTAGMVNMLVINKHCIFPRPFGPVVGGKDLFEDDLKDKLTSLGLTPHPMDDWYEYHVNLGEVHCATNALRTPTKVNWWEFIP